uniref:cytochrome f n=1 Tax=Haramonas pauciplastida TaxID=478668 RepID=UPI0021157D3C|nr:cytochrome f [Haramonas pauciplastida]UTE95014.1 cytochrome f [Haramonas pauciplastida]
MKIPQLKYWINFFLKNSVALLLLSILTISTSLSLSAYPIFAQQAYANPREANGRIACANCHLAQKPVEIESPSAILPDSVFEAIIKIPYDISLKQVTGSGKLGGLNVGAVVILPEDFKLAPKTRIPKEIQEKNKGVYITPYSSDKDNILVVGPIAGEKYQEIIFPVLSPDPKENKNSHFIKYPIYVGGNRGRGQVYPTGEKSNNNIITSSTTGTISEIKISEKGETSIFIKNIDGNEIKQVIPAGLTLIVSENADVKFDQPLTKDPNVGGFGQAETEIVLQSPERIVGYMAMVFTILLCQILLVIKKKQFEKVQASEFNF